MNWYEHFINQIKQNMRMLNLICGKIDLKGKLILVQKNLNPCSIYSITHVFSELCQDLSYLILLREFDGCRILEWDRISVELCKKDRRYQQMGNKDISRGANSLSQDLGADEVRAMFRKQCPGWSH